MGQKVHPGGLRVGVIHDWKSNWYTGKKEFAGLHPRGRQDPRAHPRQARARRPVGHPDPQGQAADHGRHLHRAPGHRDRQVGRRGRRAAQGAARDHQQERPHQHQRDQAARARREARRAVDRRAAPEPRQLPARDEALARLRDPLGRAGHQDRLRRPPRRRRDEPLGDVLRGPRAAAHDPRRHRLRLRRGEDDVRPHRRQGLDQQGRDHAGGLRGHGRRRRTRASATRIRRAAGAAAAEGLGASREGGRGRGQDREGLGPVQRRRQPRPAPGRLRAPAGGGRPRGPRPRAAASDEPATRGHAGARPTPVEVVEAVDTPEAVARDGRTPRPQTTAEPDASEAPDRRPRRSRRHEEAGS